MGVPFLVWRFQRETPPQPSLTDSCENFATTNIWCKNGYRWISCQIGEKKQHHRQSWRRPGTGFAIPEGFQPLHWVQRILQERNPAFPEDVQQVRIASCSSHMIMTQGSLCFYRCRKIFGSAWHTDNWTFPVSWKIKQKPLCTLCRLLLYFVITELSWSKQLIEVSI